MAQNEEAIANVYDELVTAELALAEEHRGEAERHRGYAQSNRDYAANLRGDLLREALGLPALHLGGGEVAA
ncbi:hypothetical protein ACFCX0_38780 [Streptomyces sp. NPDC056352]|uniref:hypothetical protein n=1 Tax=Streptomyces sp. NPDC056352 TaxID=3345791 RepID=UPI0035DF07F2